MSSKPLTWTHTPTRFSLLIFFFLFGLYYTGKASEQTWTSGLSIESHFIKFDHSFDSLHPITDSAVFIETSLPLIFPFLVKLSSRLSLDSSHEKEMYVDMLTRQIGLKHHSANITFHYPTDYYFSLFAGVCHDEWHFEKNSHRISGLDLKETHIMTQLLFGASSDFLWSDYLKIYGQLETGYPIYSRSEFDSFAGESRLIKPLLKGTLGFEYWLSNECVSMTSQIGYQKSKIDGFLLPSMLANSSFYIETVELRLVVSFHFF